VKRCGYVKLIFGELILKKPTEADVFFIKSNKDKDLVVLTKATGLTNTQVKNLLNKENEKLGVTQAKPKSQFEMSLAKHKDRKGVVMMTEGASQASDDARTGNKAKDTSSYISKARP